MSSSRTNIRSAGKLSTRAVRSFLPFWIRRPASRSHDEQLAIQCGGDLPHARGSLHGASLINFTRENFARAVIEGTLASQVEMLDALRACDVRPGRVLLIGGAAQSPAVQEVLTQMIDLPVFVPAFEEYVAKGAAMQAASTLAGDFPSWPATVAELPARAHEAVIAAQHDAAKHRMGYDGAAVGHTFAT